MKKIIKVTIGVVVLGVLIFQAYYLYQTRLIANNALQGASISYQTLTAMGTPDKDGVTGFDKLVNVSLSKLKK